MLVLVLDEESVAQVKALALLLLLLVKARRYQRPWALGSTAERAFFGAEARSRARLRMLI